MIKKIAFSLLMTTLLFVCQSYAFDYESTIDNPNDFVIKFARQRVETFTMEFDWDGYSDRSYMDTWQGGGGGGGGLYGSYIKPYLSVGRNKITFETATGECDDMMMMGVGYTIKVNGQYININGRNYGDSMGGCNMLTLTFPALYQHMSNICAYTGTSGSCPSPHLYNSIPRKWTLSGDTVYINIPDTVYLVDNKFALQNPELAGASSDFDFSIGDRRGLFKLVHTSGDRYNLFYKTDVDSREDLGSHLIRYEEFMTDRQYYYSNTYYTTMAFGIQASLNENDFSFTPSTETNTGEVLDKPTIGFYYDSTSNDNKVIFGNSTFQIVDNNGKVSGLIPAGRLNFIQSNMGLVDANGNYLGLSQGDNSNIGISTIGSISNPVSIGNYIINQSSGSRALDVDLPYSLSKLYIKLNGTNLTDDNYTFYIAYGTTTVRYPDGGTEVVPTYSELYKGFLDGYRDILGGSTSINKLYVKVVVSDPNATVTNIEFFRE